MEIRELKGQDLFKMSKIIKKLNIDIKETKDQTKLGMEIMKNIFENMYLAENEINEFISDITGYTKEKVQELSLVEYKEILIALKNKEGINDFFKGAMK